MWWNDFVYDTLITACAHVSPMVECGMEQLMITLTLQTSLTIWNTTINRSIRKPRKYWPRPQSGPHVSTVVICHINCYKLNATINCETFLLQYCLTLCHSCVKKGQKVYKDKTCGFVEIEQSKNSNGVGWTFSFVWVTVSQTTAANVEVVFSLQPHFVSEDHRKPVYGP